jgi:hypothetical protein
MTDVEKQRLILVVYLIDDVITIVEQYLNCKFFLLPDPEWEKSSSKWIECYNNKKIHWCKQMGTAFQPEKENLLPSYFSFFKREKKENSFSDEEMKNVKYLNLPLSKLNLLPSKLPQLLMLKIIIGKSKTSVIPECLANCSSLQYLHLKLNESVDENFFKSLSIPSLQSFRVERLFNLSKEINFVWSDLICFIKNHQKTLKQLELLNYPGFGSSAFERDKLLLGLNNYENNVKYLESLATIDRSNFIDEISKSEIQHLNLQAEYSPLKYYEPEIKLNMKHQLLSLKTCGLNVCLDNQHFPILFDVDSRVTFDWNSMKKCESLSCLFSHFKSLNVKDARSFKFKNLSVENNLNGAFEIDSKVVQLIQKSPHLEELNLTRFELKQSFFDSLNTSITSLSLHRCRFDISLLSSDGVVPKLSKLIISNSNIAWKSKDYLTLANIALNRPLLTEIDLKFIHQVYCTNESKEEYYYQLNKWVKIPHLKKLFFPQLTSSQTLLLMEELAENPSLLLSSLTHIGTLHFYKLAENSATFEIEDNEEIQNFFDSAGIVLV